MPDNTPNSHGLTATRLREVMSYDPVTGNFRWFSAQKASRSRNGIAGTVVLYGKYRAIRVDWNQHLEHRLAWLYIHGVWPAHDIDHINGNGLDNRIANLRDVPRKINAENTRKGRRGLLGTSFNKAYGNWGAFISHHYKSIHLGNYATEQEAHEAYLAAKRKLHAGCTI